MSFYETLLMFHYRQIYLRDQSRPEDEVMRLALVASKLAVEPNDIFESLAGMITQVRRKPYDR